MQDITAYLRHGRNGKTAAFGPMAEVVTNSTQYMTDGDLTTIATYLKALTAAKDARSRPLASSTSAMVQGKLVYDVLGLPYV